MILWIDDDTLSALDSFIDEISENGWDVILAEDPDQMWNILSDPNKSINGIIMDIMLPTGESIDSAASKMGIIGGLELIKKLKADDKYMNIPIIIFTIVDEPEVNEYAEKNNIPLLKKQDVFQDDLIEVIERNRIEKDRQCSD